MTGHAPTAPGIGTIADAVAGRFAQRFGTAPPLLVRSPGRVNLIGEHTDYNDGFVLPLAIEKAVWLALRPRADRIVEIESLDFGEAARIDLDELHRGGPAWSEYARGIAWALASAGLELIGWEGVLGSDVPIGAGLSSSAALELAVARGFAAAADLPWDAVAMAEFAQRAENEWVGMQCGIMDQLIVAAGRADHALLIDCRSLAMDAVRLPADAAVVILDTATRRELVDSAYNARRRECARAAAFFGVRALRDVLPVMLDRDAAGLDAVLLSRARHVVTENARTLQAAAALTRGDAAAVGALMNASHDSLRDDYEVSSVALDTMVDVARAQPACHGARMTGAGFGGCVVALVEREGSETFAADVAAGYAQRTGRRPQAYITGASAGAAVVGQSG